MHRTRATSCEGLFIEGFLLLSSPLHAAKGGVKGAGRRAQGAGAGQRAGQGIKETINQWKPVILQL